MSDANSNNGSLTKHMVLSKTRANALTDIKAINFWGFNLKDVSIFKSMPNVEVVSMPMTYITSLEQFSFCPNLRELLLRQNLISDFQEIEHLSGLNFLTRLWLSDNPICNVSGYRKRVISMLPQLKVLDEIPITNEERFGNTLPNFPKHEYNDYNDNSHRDMPENQVPNTEYTKPRPKRLIKMSQYQNSIKSTPELSSTVKPTFQFNPRSKSDEASLTAILALLPNLSSDSLTILLDKINDMSQSM